MNKSKLEPSILVAIFLIVSSLILSYSMGNLGEDIIAAGIYSNSIKISLSHANNGAPLRILLEKRSEINLGAEQNTGQLTLLTGVRLLEMSNKKCA